MIPRRIADKFPPNPWTRGYIIGKLRTDPVYPAAHAVLRDRPGPLWDGGCGLGLLAFYLREQGWTGTVIGTDLDAKKIGQGSQVAQAHYPGVDLRTGSIASPPEGFQGDVALLDVIHYLPPADQQQLLQQVRSMVPVGGRVIIRFTAKDRSWRYFATMIEEGWIKVVGWIRGGTNYFPTQTEVSGSFIAAGWETSLSPLWGRTPFNSYLFTARRLK